VLDIKQKDWKAAQKNVDSARESMTSKFTSLLGESYNRAYGQIKELQFLKELEEVIEYKKSLTQEKKNNLYKCWVNRSKSIPSTDLEAHQMSLNIRLLAIEKKDEVDNFLQFAKMSQDAQNQRLSFMILVGLMKEL
jgi:serine/threonine-protein kinase mTOR